HLPTDRLSGKVAATVVVTVEHDNLRDQIGAAKLDTGHDVSAAEARRIACGAGILPIVLDGQSQILDLGRSSRYFTEAQRTALATRYDECAAEGCDRPYAWTELHHENPWHSSGRTDLELAVPLCGFHHRRMHDPKYITKITTVAGKKTVTYTRRT
ncbi:MAG: HNH endonuclease, partial [Rhodococcus sp.]|nr:HNH endonuclease [Rhodococcus sp. (in: high G+C Gram-positive bacteria)]